MPGAGLGFIMVLMTAFAKLYPLFPGLFDGLSVALGGKPFSPEEISELTEMTAEFKTLLAPMLSELIEMAKSFIMTKLG